MTSPAHREKIFNLPNLLTLFRIISVPFLIFIGIAIREGVDDFPNRLYCFIGGLIILLASLSDALDGYLARKWNAVTRVGVLFDPLADKLVILTAFIVLIPLGRVPAWAVVVFLCREMAVTSLRGFAAAEGKLIAASQLGKYKATLQAFAAGLIFLYYPYFSVDWYAVGMGFFWISLVVTIYSGYVYFHLYFQGRRS